MFADVFDMLFGCWHSRYSFPITAKKNAETSQAARVTGTYVVCLDCGKEFPYDWQKMKVLASDAKPSHTHPIPAPAVSGYGKAA